jgi:hypothetical protein
MNLEEAKAESEKALEELQWQMAQRIGDYPARKTVGFVRIYISKLEANSPSSTPSRRRRRSHPRFEVR